MKIIEIVSALERFAPLPLQDGFDNAGLQIGLTDAETTGALLCLDVTEAVIDEAIGLGCNFIISHHPLIFKGYKSITGKDYVERCILKAIKNDVVIYSAHTNLDNAHEGVNFEIARKLGLTNIRILDPKEDCLLKLVTFVPLRYAEKVRNALFDAGCGNIGNYDSCSYNLEGEGTFRAGQEATPFCGTIGSLHKEKEIRIETVLPSFLKTKILKALLDNHPYEEPAFDFYPLKNTWSRTGAGVIGEFTEPISGKEVVRLIKDTFETGCVKHNACGDKCIKTVALCGGAGGFLLPKAITCGADLFLTGEMRYHDYFGHDKEIFITEIGHYESEQYTKEIFARILKKEFPEMNIYISKVNTNPIKYS